MVCTYNEPMETVRSCVENLLASAAPAYCEVVIYIGDDGAKKGYTQSEEKRVMCEDLNKGTHLRQMPSPHIVHRNEIRQLSSLAWIMPFESYKATLHECPFEAGTICSWIPKCYLGW